MDRTNDSFQNRLEEAAKHLNMQPDQLQTKLAELGIEDSHGILDVLANPEEIKLFGELRQLLPDAKNIPLRLAVNALAGPKKPQGTQGQPDRLRALQRELGLSESAFSIEHVDLEALLQRYKAPDNMHDPVTAELKRRFGDRKVVLFKGSEVAVDETIDYALSEKGMEESPFVTIDGEPVEPLMIGVVPNTVMDEDPLFPGQPLWNNRSRKNNIDYSLITPNVRRFLRLIVERREVDVNRRLEVSTLFAELNAHRDTMINTLMEMFPETYLVFKKATEDGSLPQLKVRPGDSLRKQNPFAGNRRV